jgi:hypothetical protein
MTREEAMQSFVICTSQGALGADDHEHGSPNYKRGLQEERVPWVRGLGVNLYVCNALELARFHLI